MRASSWLPREPTSAGAPDTAPCRTRVHTTTGLRQDSACTDTPARAAPSTAAEAARALAPAEAESALEVAVSAPVAVGWRLRWWWRGSWRWRSRCQVLNG